MTVRVVILVTHLLGIGHLTRAALLADGMQAGDMDVTVITGGRPALHLKPAGWRLEQLSPVQIKGTDFSTLLDAVGNPLSEKDRLGRISQIVAVIQDTRPDILLTEHFPFGRRQLSAEFLAAIAAAKAVNPAVRVVASVRDVLVAPASPRKIDEANTRIATLYDLVLVHGDDKVLPLSQSWPDTAAIAPKLHYTGYITADSKPLPRALSSNEILVSGGGSAAALPVFSAAIQTAHASIKTDALAGLHWRILLGQGIPQRDAAALLDQAQAGPAAASITVEPARPDFPGLLARCTASVSLAGYNTMLDLVAAGCPAVVVPFDAGQETEQAVRAESWADAGLVQVVRAAELDTGHLQAALARAIEAKTQATVTLDRNGIAGSLLRLKALMASLR